MTFYNLGCGSVRPPAPWINVDSLRSQFAEGSPERDQFEAEENYVDADILQPLPFESESGDGLLLSHVLEHFDAQDGLRLMQEACRLLKPGAPIMISVPDASYFRRVYHEDRNENWVQLFDVSDPNNPIRTFFEAALWFDQHKAILTEDAVWAYLTRAGFTRIIRAAPGVESISEPIATLWAQTNRNKFSIIMLGHKP